LPRRRKSRLALRLILLGWIAGASLVTASAIADDRERYFYFGYEYGTQSLFGPLYVFLNRGYDILQIRPGSRNIFDQSYGSDAANVFRNLANPLPAVDDYGWGRFLREEIFPLSFTDETARWGPNYTLHLLGGGMEFRALWEWYADKKVPLPALFSVATLLSAALVNETLENKGIHGYNTDSIADVYFFDIGGIVLFAFDGVAKFFSRDLILSDWSLQPGFTAPKLELYNTGNYFALKWPLPFHKPLRLFGYTGLGAWAGISYQFPSRYSISIAAGQRSYRLENASVRIVNNVVQFAPSGAIFVDRNESLLASLHVSNIEDHFVQFNLYPNAFFTMDPGIGLFAIVGKNGNVVAGISLTRTFGVGVGYGSL
jgi:hypothetical protein